MNQVTITGHLTKKMELRTFKDKEGNDIPYTFVNLALSNYKGKSEDGKAIYSMPLYMNNIFVRGFAARALVNSNLAKGTALILSGDLVVRENKEYTDHMGVQHPATTDFTINNPIVGVQVLFAPVTVGDREQKQTEQKKEQKVETPVVKEENTAVDLFSDDDDTELPFA